MTTAGTVDLAELADRWHHYFEWALAAASTSEIRGEEKISQDMLMARGEVRRDAERLLRDAKNPEAVAQEMLDRARALAIAREPVSFARPAIYDLAILDYTRARTWQACAREINPDLPEVQPRWT